MVMMMRMVVMVMMMIRMVMMMILIGTQLVESLEGDMVARRMRLDKKFSEICEDGCGDGECDGVYGGECDGVYGDGWDGGESVVRGGGACKEEEV